MNFLLTNVNDQNIVSIANEIQQFKFDESQFDKFIVCFLNFAVSEPDSSLNYAKLAKELENFTVSFPKSNLKFSEELVRILHLAIDDIPKEYDLSSKSIATTIFIGNLYNESFLTSRLLRYWMSNLSALKNKTHSENLAKTVKRKVQQNLKTEGKNATLLSIMELISELKIVDDDENGFSEQEEEEEEGAWNLQSVNESRQSVKSAKQNQNNICDEFRKFLQDLPSDFSASFNFLEFDKVSESERISCAQMVLVAAKNDFGRAKIYANIVIKSKVIYIFASHIEGLIKTEMKNIFNEKSIDWNEVVAAGAFVGELYNNECIKSSLLKWMNEILQSVENLDLAVISLLLIFSRVQQKMKICDERNFKSLMKFVESAQKENLIKTCLEIETFEIRGLSSNPTVVQNFTNRILSHEEFDIEIIELLKVSTAGDRQKFIEVMFEFAKNNPEHMEVMFNYCHKVKNILESVEQSLSTIRILLEKRLVEDMNTLKPEQMFWESTTLFGNLVGSVFLNNKKCKGFVELWIEKIFKFLSLDSKTALRAFKTNSIDNILPEELEKFLDVREKLHKTFPWIQKFIKNPIADKESTDVEGKSARKLNEASKVTKDFLVYLKAIKSGSNENIFFDFLFFDPTLARELINFSLENSEFCGAFDCFLTEMRRVRFTTGNFLKRLVTKISNRIMNPVDWKKIENMGEFVEKLYQNDVITIHYFNLWMEQVYFNEDKQNAHRIFVQSFQRVIHDVKKRDHVFFETFLKMVKTIDKLNTTEPEIKSVAKQIIVSQRKFIKKTCDQLIEEVKNEKFWNLDLDEISFDGKELAYAFFREVLSVPNKVESFVEAVNLMNSFNEKTEDIIVFVEEINENSVRCFTEVDEITDENTVRFIAQLYNAKVVTAFTMKTILRNKNLEDLKINNGVKDFIPFIKNKATQNKSNEAVDKMIKEFEEKFGEVVALDPTQKFVIPPLTDPSNKTFSEIIKKILSDQTTGEVYHQILASESPDFFEYFVESAKKNPQKAANFALICKEIRSKTFKKTCITNVQRNFEKNLEIKNENDEFGINKFIGELYNIGVLTPKIILSSVLLLENNLQSSSDVLIETIAKKVIVEANPEKKEEIISLKTYVKSYLIKSSLSKKSTKQIEYLKKERLASPSSDADSSEKPSKFLENFGDYLIGKTCHFSLETFVIEGFKTCKESERYQSVDLLLSIAHSCPEKAPILARICKDFGDMFGSLTQLPKHFNSQLKERMTKELSGMKSGEEFTAQAKKYGKILEHLFNHKIDDFETIKIWVEKIFTNSKLKSELAENFLLKNDQALDNHENYQKVKKNLHQDFPWFKKFLDLNIKKDSSEDEVSENQNAEVTVTNNRVGSIFKANSGYAILKNDIKDFLDCKKKGQNVIFDHRIIRNTSNIQRKNYAKLILDEAMKSIESASNCVLLIVEINWSGWSLGNFLRIMLDVQTKFIAQFATKKSDSVDWDHASKFGNFLCELYIVEILNLVTMYAWMNKILELFENTGNETALLTFLITFEKLFESMKKRDLKNFEVFMRKVEKVSIKPELSNENLSKIQNILRHQTNIWRSSETGPIDIPDIVQQIAVGSQKGISIERFSSEDLIEFASLIVEEVSMNPNSKENILRVILSFNLMHNSFRSSAHKIFRRELNDSLVQQFEDDTDDLDGASSVFVIENIALSEFIAELYESQTVHKHTMQSIFKEINHPEDFKVLFTSVTQKVEKDFDLDKFEEVNEFLHQQVQKFRARSKEIEIEEQETAMTVSQESSVGRFWRAPSLVAATSSQSEVKDASKTGAVPKRTLPTTSGTHSLEKKSLTVNEFLIFLQNLSKHGNDKLLKIVSRMMMKSQEELLEFALAFFDARKFVNNFSVHVRLAQTIEFELFLSKPEISLKMALLEVVEISLLSLPTFEAIQAKFKKEETDAVLSLIGELYNIEWISDNKIFEVFEKFFKEDFADAEKLRYLRSLLLIVSVKLIKNCVGERFEVFSRALRKIRENFIGINDQLTCNEVLEIFETFEKFSNQQPIPRENASVDCKEIEPLLKNLNVRNFSDVARKLQALSFVCDNEIIEFAKTFIKSMLDSQQTEEKFAKLAANVENEKFQQFLVNELQHIFLDSFVSGSVSEEKTLKLIVFIAELFNLEIISNDCINLILDVLFGNEKTCNKTADYICIFITIAGLKLDEKNKSKTDRYFAFLKFVVESEEGKSYRSKVYKELIEKRTVKKTQENFVEKEISAIWKTISQDHEQIENYALLCREISMRSNSDFGDNLLNFVASQPCEPQNVNKVLFIAELFKYELLTDEFLGRWINLDQIKKLPSIIVTRIINSIANNPNTSLNVQTTALLMNLEEIVADDSEKVCEALKRDLKELAQMMEGQKQVETS